MADRTATLVFDNAAAFRAGTAFVADCLVLDVVSAVNKVVLDRFCNCIGAGKNAIVAET